MAVGQSGRRGIIYLKYGSHLSDILALHMSTFNAISTSKGQKNIPNLYLFEYIWVITTNEVFYFVGYIISLTFVYIYFRMFFRTRNVVMDV